MFEKVYKVDVEVVPVGNYKRIQVLCDCHLVPNKLENWGQDLNDIGRVESEEIRQIEGSHEFDGSNIEFDVVGLDVANDKYQLVVSEVDEIFVSIVLILTGINFQAQLTHLAELLPYFAVPHRFQL